MVINKTKRIKDLIFQKSNMSDKMRGLTGYREGTPIEKLGGLKGAQKQSQRLDTLKQQGKPGKSAQTVLNSRSPRMKYNDATKPVSQRGMGYRKGGKVNPAVFDSLPKGGMRTSKRTADVEFNYPNGKVADGYVKEYMSIRDANVKGGKKYIDNVFGFDV